MAIKLATFAPVNPFFGTPKEVVGHIDVLLCGSTADFRDRVEIWGFILPADHSGIDFAEFTFGEANSDAVESACRNAALWRRREPLFEKVVADDKLKPRQAAVARKFFDSELPVQEILDGLVEDGKIYVDRYKDGKRSTDFRPPHTTKS